MFFEATRVFEEARTFFALMFLVIRVFDVRFHQRLAFRRFGAIVAAEKLCFRIVSELGGERCRRFVSTSFSSFLTVHKGIMGHQAVLVFEELRTLFAFILFQVRVTRHVLFRVVSSFELFMANITGEKHRGRVKSISHGIGFLACRLLLAY